MLVYSQWHGATVTSESWLDKMKFDLPAWVLFKDNFKNQTDQIFG